MRVLMVTEHRTAPGVGGGGAESMLRDQTKALVALGHQVAWWQGDGTIEQAVQEFQPAIVQVNTIHNAVGPYPVRFLQEQHVPHVWAIMDYWPFCRGRMLLRSYDEPCSAVRGVCDEACREGRQEPLWLELANGSPIVALNAHTADIYRRNGLRVDAVVELGVDTDLFSPDPSPRGNGSVSIYTSSAWAAFPAKGMCYVEDAIKGSEYGVQLLTGLPRERVATGLKKADIFVFPSTYEETWGLCLNEAMASGCACIASDVAGARAQLHNGLGVLVQPRDSYALWEAIDWLSKDHEMRIELGQQSREHVEADHTLEAMGRRWESVYRDVMGRGE